MKSITLSHSPVSAPEITLSSKSHRSIVLLDCPCHQDDLFALKIAVLMPPNTQLRICVDAPGNMYEIRYPEQIGSSSDPMLIPDCQTEFIQLFQSVYGLLSSNFVQDLLAENTINLVIQWFEQLIPRHRENIPLPNYRQLAENARKIILEEYATDLTLERVAERLYINSCYLSTMFRKHTGCTFRSYLRSVRLEHARKLVTQTNMQITDIAMQVGFNSSAYLIRSFREVYHTTPMALRQQAYKHNKK